MTKINRIKWDDLITPAWERDLEKQIEEESGKGSMAPQWLSPTDPLFAVPDLPEELPDEEQPWDPEWDKIQSVPYNEFDQYWEEKMREQKKELNGGNKGGTIQTS